MCIECRNTNRSLTDINIKEFQVKQYHNNTNQDTHNKHMAKNINIEAAMADAAQFIVGPDV